MGSTWGCFETFFACDLCTVISRAAVLACLSLPCQHKLPASVLPLKRVDQHTRRCVDGHLFCNVCNAWVQRSASIWSDPHRQRQKYASFRSVKFLRKCRK